MQTYFFFLCCFLFLLRFNLFFRCFVIVVSVLLLILFYLQPFGVSVPRSFSSLHFPLGCLPAAPFAAVSAPAYTQNARQLSIATCGAARQSLRYALGVLSLSLSACCCSPLSQCMWNQLSLSCCKCKMCPCLCVCVGNSEKERELPLPLPVPLSLSH